jgi:hypothetical protein
VNVRTREEILMFLIARNIISYKYQYVLTIESSLAKYPAKILPKAKKIKGIAIRMGTS